MGKMKDIQIEFEDFCYMITIEWGVKDYHKWLYGTVKDYKVSTRLFNDLQLNILNDDFTWKEYVSLKQIREYNINLLKSEEKPKESDKWVKFCKLPEIERNKRLNNNLDYILFQEKNNKDIDKELSEYFLFKNL